MGLTKADSNFLRYMCSAWHLRRLSSSEDSQAFFQEQLGFFRSTLMVRRRQSARHQSQWEQRRTTAKGRGGSAAKTGCIVGRPSLHNPCFTIGNPPNSSLRLQGLTTTLR